MVNQEVVLLTDQEYKDLKCLVRGDEHDLEFYTELKANRTKSKYSTWHTKYYVFECNICGYITGPRYANKVGTFSTPTREGDLLKKYFPKKSK